MDHKELRISCLDRSQIRKPNAAVEVHIEDAGKFYDFCVGGRRVQSTADKDVGERIDPVTDRTNVCGLEQSSQVVFDKESIRGASGIVKFTVILTPEGHIEIDGLHGASRWRTGIVVPVPR